MEILEFHHKKHRIYIKKWLSDRHLDEAYADDLPAKGVIAFHENSPVSAGFIRISEGRHGIIDSLITDPEKSSDIRDAANNLVTATLITLGKQLNLKQIIAFSVDDNTLMRAEAHGFKRLPHTVISFSFTTGQGV